MKYVVQVCIFLAVSLSLKSQSLEYIFSGCEDCFISNIAVAEDSTFFINEIEDLKNGEKASNVYKSTNRGVDWELIWSRQSYPDMQPVRTYYARRIVAKNSNTIVMCGYNGIFFQSLDGGKTWDSSYVEELFGRKIISFDRHENEVVIAIDRLNEFLYSSDYGLSWKTLKTLLLPFPHNPVNVVFEKKNSFLVSANGIDKIGSLICRYQDGSWTRVDTITQDLIFQIYTIQNNQYLIIYRHIDSMFTGGDGETYINYKYRLFDSDFEFSENIFSRNVHESDYFSPSVATYDDKLLLSCNDTIWISDNRGETWSYVTENNEVYRRKGWLNGVDLLDNGFGLYQDQIAVYLYNPGPTSVEDDQREDNSISIYPNPSSDLITVTYVDEGLEDVIIFDVQGKEVGSFDDGSRVQDVSYLESGTYYLRFSFRDKIKIRQLVISR